MSYIAFMHLDSIHGQGIEATRYLERYVNDIRPGSHSRWSDTSPLYSPHAGLESFGAPQYFIRRELARVISANPDPNLVSAVVPEDVIFTVHPEMQIDPSYVTQFGFTLFRNWCNIRVTPTASTRTLLPCGSNAFYFIKTDLDRRHYGFARSLKESGVIHSLFISREFDEITAKGTLAGFGFLPETIGVILRDSEGDGTTGVIYREVTPRPNVADRRTLVPYFSLYAPDMRNSSHAPLLVQLIRRHGNQHGALDYFLERLIFPLIRVWSRVVTEHGILLEMHGQNTLIEIDADLRPARIIVRDFQGMYLDEAIRNQRGLSLPSRDCLAGTEKGITPEKHYSHLFDHLIGDLLLHRMTYCFVRYFTDYNYSEVADAIAQNVRGVYDVKKWLPPDAYTYDKEVRDGEVCWIESARRRPNFR